MKKLLIYVRFFPICFISFFNNEILKKDFERWCEINKMENNRYTFMYLLYTFKEFRNIVIYRYSDHPLLRRYIGFWYHPLSTLYIESKKIGGGMFIQHGFSTMIAAESIGENCWINQQVTIGYSGSGRAPIIGDNVMITCGAKVLGSITVGDNVVIGANAVVIKDTESNCTMVGIPAKKVIKKEMSKNEY